jgi:hypothetical protein
VEAPAVVAVAVVVRAASVGIAVHAPDPPSFVPGVEETSAAVAQMDEVVADADLAAVGA